MNTVTDQTDEMKVELDRLRAENEALKKTKSKGLTLKVSKKGGVVELPLGGGRDEE